MLFGVDNSVSRAALLAALGLFLVGAGAPTAKAADLGGDCCADLEERVAELEATTVRKGNRRMSVTVSGQVNRSVLYWNDGDKSNVYAGLENHAASTRFGFSGNAKIGPTTRAGFEFLIETPAGARTSRVTQDSPDGGTSADGTLAVRTANWWLEEKSIGRLTVGRINLNGPVATIDLGGISVVGQASPSQVGGRFIIAGGGTLESLVGPTYGGDRIEGIRYDSPNIGGFVLQAAWGEDEVWSASIRYAGEFGGIRVAAGIGYQEQDPTGQLDTSTPRADSEWAGSVAVLHVASGLFAQGQYARSQFEDNSEGTIWLVQAGITKNWFGIGNTALYGEYGNAQDFAIYTLGATGSDVDFYGVGIVQNIDAAAMELYLGWRRFETKVVGGPDAGSGEIDFVHGGARVRF